MKHKKPTISHDFIKNCSQFSAAVDAISSMDILSRGINKILESIDKPQYDALVALHEVACHHSGVMKMLSSIDPLLMEGRAIMYNRKTPPHADRQDPYRGWAVMITFGNFTTGGTLYIRRLRLRIRYLPGDVVVLRGRLLEHEVEEWGLGQRVSIAHFTHESLWRHFGMVCP